MGGFLEMSKFQMIFLGIFGAFILTGLLLFAISGGRGGGERFDILIWGTVPSSNFSQITNVAGIDRDDSLNVTYVQKDPVTYNTELVDALAAGRGPDIFFVKHQDLSQHKNKITPISFELFSARDYSDTFVRASQVFVFEDGIYAFPIVVDPMVMYWNTTLFSNAGIARPPQYWDEFFDLVPRLTDVDANLNISQSAFALGEFNNVTHAKELLSALLFQNDIPIANVSQGRYTTQLGGGGTGSNQRGVNVLNFYTQFANSTNNFYTWNRSLPASRDYFLQTDLAIYFGFASEMDMLRQRNPNLSFDVAPFPQTRDGFERITFGNVTGLAIANNSPNKSTAYRVIRMLTESRPVESFANIRRTPPVRFDTMKNAPEDPYVPIFQQMALWSKSWPEPTPEEATDAFRQMVNNITGGQRSISVSLTFAQGLLNEAYRRLGL